MVDKYGDKKATEGKKAESRKLKACLPLGGSIKLKEKIQSRRNFINFLTF
jgi:hypothetical protein